MLGQTFAYIGNVFKRWADELSAPGERMNALQLAARGILLAFQAFAVIASDVAFVVETIARALITAAQTLFLIAQFDFSGVGKIWEQEEAAAAAARKQLDAYQAGILKLGETSKDTATKLADALKKGLGGGAGGGGGGGASSTDKEIERLKARAEAIADSVNPLHAYNKAMAELNELLEKGYISEVNYSRAKLKANDALNAAGDAIRNQVDPLFKYQNELDKVNRLYMQGAIEIETYVAMQEKLKKELDKNQGVFDWSTKLKDVATTAGSAIGDFFNKIVTGSATAAEAFQAMAEDIIKAIAKVIAEAAAAWVVKEVFSGVAGGATAGGNMVAPTWAPGAAWAPAVSSLSTFSMSREGTAGAGGGGGVVKPNPFQVNVHNYAPGVDVQATQDSSGLKITVDRVRAALSQDVVRGGNAFARAMESTYGVGRGR